MESSHFDRWPESMRWATCGTNKCALNVWHMNTNEFAFESDGNTNNFTNERMCVKRRMPVCECWVLKLIYWLKCWWNNYSSKWKGVCKCVATEIKIMNAKSQKPAVPADTPPHCMQPNTENWVVSKKFKLIDGHFSIVSIAFSTKTCIEMTTQSKVARY